MTEKRVSYPKMTDLLWAIQDKQLAYAPQLLEAIIKDPNIESGFNIHALVASVDDFWQECQKKHEDQVPMMKGMDLVQRIEVVAYNRNGVRLEEVKK
jgi:hypothetical protein